MRQQIFPEQILGTFESGIDETFAVVDLIVDLPFDEIRERITVGRASHFFFTYIDMYAKTDRTVVFTLRPFLPCILQLTPAASSFRSRYLFAIPSRFLRLSVALREPGEPTGNRENSWRNQTLRDYYRLWLL